MLIACPTCGRLQFDMDSVVAEIEQRLEAYEDPIEVAVLGCAVNGIGEARHADFGITGAKDEGMIFSKGEPLKKVADGAARRRAVRRDRPLLRRGKKVVRDENAAAEAAQWLSENEDDSQMTPERLAALEAAANEQAGGGARPAGRRRGDAAKHRRDRLAGRRSPLQRRAPEAGPGAARPAAAGDQLSFPAACSARRGRQHGRDLSGPSGEEVAPRERRGRLRAAPRPARRRASRARPRRSTATRRGACCGPCPLR